MWRAHMWACLVWLRERYRQGLYRLYPFWSCSSSLYLSHTLPLGVVTGIPMSSPTLSSDNPPLSHPSPPIYLSLRWCFLPLRIVAGGVPEEAGLPECVHVLMIGKAAATGITWYFAMLSVGLKVQRNFKPQTSACCRHMVAYTSLH